MPDGLKATLGDYLFKDRSFAGTVGSDERSWGTTVDARFAELLKANKQPTPVVPPKVHALSLPACLGPAKSERIEALSKEVGNTGLKALLLRACAA